MALSITTAVAAGPLLIRCEGSLPPGASQAVAEQVEAIGQHLQFAITGDPEQVDKELEELRSNVSEESSLPAPFTDMKATSEDTLEALPEVESSSETSTGQNLRANNGPGVDSEIEIAVSTDGQNIVIGNNLQDFSFSNDGGRTFTIRTINPGFPTRGDPSLAIGRLGSFFFAFIGLPDGSPAARNVRGCSTSVAVSTDNGQTFTFRNHATLCPLSGIDMCFPDQEHIAADQRVIPAPPNVRDQVYSVWRHFTPSGRPPATCGQISGGSVTPSITCSIDSGFNWEARRSIDARGRDFPRVTIGQDGECLCRVPQWRQSYA